MEKRMQYIEANLELIKTLLMGDKKTLTLEETCNYTGYTKSYMYKLTSGQQIPHINVVKRYSLIKMKLMLGYDTTKS